jgi:N-acetylneuraminate synthase
MSSPFSIEAVELLEAVGMTRYKIPSGEVTNIPLLEIVATTGKPVILSSGMSSWSELDTAVNTILRRHDRLTVLQCTSEYPCPYEEVGLNVMLEMRDRYRTQVGLSDHTLTPYASHTAVALGASVIEKHFSFSRLMYGSDAQHSLEPAEFADLVQGIRAVELMLHSRIDKDALAGKMVGMKQIFEKSVVSVRDIPEGTQITTDMIAVKKPGTGIPARQFSEVVGKIAKRFIPSDTVLQDEDIHA